MIKGNRKGALVWSSRSHGGPRNRLHIESKTYDVIFTAIDRRVFPSEGRLHIGKRGRYEYNPSERYRKALAAYYKVPVRRVGLNELVNN